MARGWQVTEIHKTVAQRQIAAILLVAGMLLFASSSNSLGQRQGSDWQQQVRELAKAQQWETALKTVERRLAEVPHDLEARGWRARLLTWMDRLPEAESEYRVALASAPNDGDLLEGLAGVLAREQRFREALLLLNQAIELDPRRSDLLLSRGRILRALDRRTEAHADFAAAMYLDPSSREARDGLASLRPEPHHELRIGSDTDWFNYADANQAQSASLASRWSSRWSTNFAAAFYQRAGFLADKSTASVTGRSAKRGALPVGGAMARDQGIIPRSEAFLEYGRGWRLSETGFLRGLETSGGPHWFWYSPARILTVSGTTLVYFPGRSL